MSRLFASSCEICHVRLEDGSNRCLKHRKPRLPVPEPERHARQPWRGRYRSPEYLRNRIVRFEEYARGRCECGCGEPIGIEPRDWECDHVVAIVDGGTDAIDNLRCYRTGHHHAKTAEDRRRRKGD